MTAVVFLDTETTGLSTDDHVWDFAAIRREEDGTETEWQTFLDHDTELAEQLPEPFLSDYARRYDSLKSLTAADFRRWVLPLFAGRPHIVGTVPDFDMTRIRTLLGTHRFDDPWHYHLIDVETLAVGFLHAWIRSGNTTAMGAPVWVPDPPWDSEDLSHAVGVNPGWFDRHTAMGDTQWAKAIYDAVMVTP